MNTYIVELRDRFTENLVRSAREYLDVGFDLFYSHLASDRTSIQSALGMLATGAELAVKAYIAEKDLGLIFRELPPDARVYLSCPETVPHFFQWRRYEPDIRTDRFPTLNLGECIDCFYIFFPHHKQLLMPHLVSLLRWGFASRHTTLPDIGAFEFERTGYAVLQMLSLLAGEETSRLIYYSLTDRDRQFIDSFDGRRVERVNYALEQAKSDLTSSDDAGVVAIVARDWETHVTPCPVCGYNGYLKGYTEIALGRDDDGVRPTLDFFATTFSCDVCGLQLNDLEELKLAGMGLLYDRANDLGRWFHEHGDFTAWMLE
jgi:hypothetical protein